MLDRVKLSAEFKTTPDRLTVAFTISNGRDGDIYIIDRAFQVGPQGLAIRPDHLSVAIGDGGLATLSTKLPPIDPTIQWATPPVVYATPVRAGQRYANEVSAPLPLRPEGWHVSPADLARIPAEQVGKCTRLVFELGVIAAPPGTAAPAQQFAGVPVVQLGAHVAKQQEVLMVEQEGMGVPCIQ